jgi:hypothetical protein
LILADHHEAFEYDLLRMGIRLVPDFYDGTLSLRLLTKVVLPQIGRDSALARSIDPDAELFESWKTTDYLLAALVDAYYAVHSKSAKPVQRPIDIVRTRERSRALEEQAARVRRQLAERGR